MELTVNQQIAVDEISNNLQIIACAGSGKTEVITRRIVNILKHNYALPEEIIAFTFTEKSAKTMKNRIIKALLETNYDKLQLVDEMFTGTIHGYCYNLLKKYTNKFNDFSVLDSVKNFLFLKKNFNICGAKELGLSFNVNNIKLFEDCIAKMVDDYEEKKLWNNNNLEAFNKYRNLLYKEKYLDFSILILEAIYQMSNNNEVEDYLKKIKYLIVDEYQDVDDLQEKIIKMFYDYNANICVVGDDDQTIYQFRGSNANNMINFSQRYDNVTQVKLEENFRSTSSIVNLADTIIKNNKERLSKRMFSRNNNKSIIEGYCFRSKTDEHNGLIDMIKKLHLTDDYKDIAILVRKNKYINEIAEELNNNNIPYVTDSADYFFKGKNFKLFCNTLKILVNIDKSQLYKIWNGIVADESISKGYKYLRNISRIGGNRNVIKLSDIISSFLKEIDFLSNNQKRISEFNNFKIILDDYDEIYKDYQLSSRINGLIDFLENEALEQYKYHNFSTELSENGINIMSIHKSKGLEFNSVIILGMLQGDFPANSSGGKKYYHVLKGIFETKKEKYDSSLDDERKLFYVAITRAKKNLIMYSECSKKKISQFFMESYESKIMKVDDKSMEVLNENTKLKINKSKIKKLREEVLDELHAASCFYSSASADLISAYSMTDEEIIQKALALHIINTNNIDDLYN